MTARAIALSASTPAERKTRNALPSCLPRLAGVTETSVERLTAKTVANTAQARRVIPSANATAAMARPSTTFCANPKRHALREAPRPAQRTQVVRGRGEEAQNATGAPCVLSCEVLEAVAAMCQEREARDERWYEHDQHDCQTVSESWDQQRRRRDDHEFGHAFRQLVENDYRDTSGGAQPPACGEQAGAGSMARQGRSSIGDRAGDGDYPEHRSARDPGSLR